ncbi:MAG TPA: CBS domain-containing protein [Nitrospirae bacterium]|nr:CBS domain-containing protein [Nitrospirota bacterium]
MVVKVKDVMIENVVTIDAMATMTKALDLMMDKNVKSLVVPPKNESDAFGILTFSDIAKQIIAKDDQQVEMLNVYDIMSKPCYSVGEELDIKYAAAMMTNINVSRMIVIDGSTLKGIVSLTDLVKSLAAKNG